MTTKLFRLDKLVRLGAETGRLPNKELNLKALLDSRNE